jgi:hypothetical protein
LPDIGRCEGLCGSRGRQGGSRAHTSTQEPGTHNTHGETYDNQFCHLGRCPCRQNTGGLFPWGTARVSCTCTSRSVRSRQCQSCRCSRFPCCRSGGRRSRGTGDPDCRRSARRPWRCTTSGFCCSSDIDFGACEVHSIHALASGPRKGGGHTYMLVLHVVHDLPAICLVSRLLTVRFDG